MSIHLCVSTFLSTCLIIMFILYKVIHSEFSVIKLSVYLFHLSLSVSYEKYLLSHF
jgi:hypothetical protein